MNTSPISRKHPATVSRASRHRALLPRLAWIGCALAWLFATVPVTRAGQSYTWKDFAGPIGGPGTANGPESAARFYYPAGVAVDSAGDVYVADTWNHTIRKITPAGVVSTFAGKAGHSGHADGTGNAAQFSFPQGVAVDSAGNVYVADTGNSTIRKITPAGVVTTLAGQAGQGDSADGTGSAARFDVPTGIAVDSAGTVYVVDSDADTVRKITPAGVVSTLAGKAYKSGSADGAGSAARFNDPSGVAVDSAGNVYVADTESHTIRKITPAGAVSTLAGAGHPGDADGAGSAARFRYPSGVTVDSAGNVYVGDTYNESIRKITPAGVVSTLAGSNAGRYGSADGAGNRARFNYPAGVALDAAGNIYVADASNFTIRKITPAGVVSTLAGKTARYGSADGAGSAARFVEPFGVAADSAGNVYVADTGNSTIRKITPAGVVTTLAGNAGQRGSADGTGSAARFYFPQGLAVDSAGNVYVADTYNGTIRKITPAGVVTTFAGTAGSFGSADGTGNAAQFYYPGSVAVDSAGNVYVADTYNYTIRKITPAAVVSTLAGSASHYGSADGTHSAARFDTPGGVAVDSAGNVYVADTYNDTIRKITPAGVVTTFAGDAGSRGDANGTGGAARFTDPSSVALDSAGNVYVADAGNELIRKITPAGVVSTVGGTGKSARFAYPQGIAVDATGNIYVANSDNNTIERGAP